MPKAHAASTRPSVKRDQQRRHPGFHRGVHAMLARSLSRRRFLATTASAAVLAMPHVRGAYAAGKLTIGLWDHWVPGANAATKALVEEWAAREKVEVQIDYMNN